MQARVCCVLVCPGCSHVCCSFLLLLLCTERISELIHALLHFGYVDQSRTLQHELREFLRVVAAEEAAPMPMMENPTPEQRAALIAYWNWPAMAYPERALAPKQDHLCMPFLFPKPSTKQAAQAAEQARLAAEAQTLSQVSEGATQASVASAIQPQAVIDQDADEGDMFGALM